MKKSIELLRRGFESSTGKTPEFMAFTRTFRSELKKILISKGCTNIEIGTGHFYMSGFFTAPSGQIYYWSISDLRGYNENGTWGSMLYRTAEHYKDYTGGGNQYARLTNLEEELRIK